MNAKPPNSGRPWDEEADADLRARLAKRQTVSQIAKGMGRTHDAIRGRAAQLRIPVRSSLRPWRDGVIPKPSDS
jgi:hypothetical protein